MTKDHLKDFDPILAALGLRWTMDLDAAPMRKDDDLAYAGMAFYRERNPDGEMPVIVEQPGHGRAIRLTVRRDAYPHATSEGSENVLRDRCELRDARIPLGTEVWYGFSLRVPADFPRVFARFVCAQMKAPYDVSGDGSPLFALRIENGRFLATIEQLFEPGDWTSVTPLGPQGCAPDRGRALDHLRRPVTRRPARRRRRHGVSDPCPARQAARRRPALHGGRVSVLHREDDRRALRAASRAGRRLERFRRRPEAVADRRRARLRRTALQRRPARARDGAVRVSGHADRRRSSARAVLQARLLLRQIARLGGGAGDPRVP